jgi:CubicO group peptidase (beta-lactamase class C family)
MKSLLKLFLVALTGITALQMFQSAVSPAREKSRAPELDSAIRQQMKEGRLAGIGAAIIVDKKVVWMNGYGYADIAQQKPFLPHTIMNTGSIAKTFTGICMMKAVEQKLISLDEDINTYLPFKVINPHLPNDKITLRQIATHTSSLMDRYPFYSDSLYFTGKDSPEALGDFLKNYFVPGGTHYSTDNFHNSKPGTYWEYCNTAAALAGYIVELRTGMKLNEFSRKYIQQPLKMFSTGWFFSEFDLNRHAKLYRVSGDSIIEIPLYGQTTYPDGGVRSSVSDLCRLFISLLNDGCYGKTCVLEKSSVNEMTRMQFTEALKPENIDVSKKNEGLFWRTKNNGKFIGHGGSDPGIKTEMLADPGKEVAVILFTNTDLDGDAQARSYYKIFELLMEKGRELKAKKKK